MFRNFAILPACLLVSGVWAEEPVEPVQEIESTKVIHNKGRTITIHRVTAPPATPNPPGQAETPNVVTLPPQDVTTQKEPVSFTISATIIDDTVTMLEWQSQSDEEPHKIVSFSNINWNHFQGLQTIEDETHAYTYALFPRNITRAEFDTLTVDGQPIEFPEHLPSIEQGGAHYTVIDQNGISPIGTGFMEAVHKLYDEKGEEIKKAYEKRKKRQEERERELRENPPKPKDVVIKFWKREPTQETSTEESE